MSAGEMENLVMDQLEALHQGEHRDARDCMGTGTSSRRRCQHQEGKRSARMLQQYTKQSQWLLLYHNVV